MRRAPASGPPTLPSWAARTRAARAAGVSAALLAAALLGGCAPVQPLIPPPQPLSPNERVTYARKALEDARAYVEQERWDAADRATAHGLALEPDDAELHRLRARVLRELGRTGEANDHARRADELDPPPAMPPSTPFERSAEDVLVVLLPPHPDRWAGPGRVPSDWPQGEVAETLERRLRTRLPGASVVQYVPDTLPAARTWLDERGPRSVISLRVDRAYCDSTLKDGDFAVSWIRVASARADGSGSDAELVREVVDDPRMLGGCRREAVARGLEKVLALAQVGDALEAPLPAPDHARWGTPAVRQLFPSLDERVDEQLDAGRDLLSMGQVAEAADAFRRAVAIDPEHMDALSYLQEAETTLGLSGELSRREVPGEASREAASEGGPEAPRSAEAESFDPHFSASQRRVAEQRLREEQRRRDQLLAALAVLQEDRFAPTPQVLKALQPVKLRAPDEPGPTLARARAGGAVEARALYAPDGTVLAVYYFAAGSKGSKGSQGTGSKDAPVLREEDTHERGRPDRWIGYRDGVRSDVWEDTQENGKPDLHLAFAESGHPLERIEIDADGDGRPERVFRYADGKLASESRDTNGDGVLDRTDTFDADGQVATRAEDVNGDGQVDVRTIYKKGRIVRREVLSPDLVEKL